jgi:hypothetical protein
MPIGQWGQIRNMRARAQRQSDAAIRALLEQNRSFESGRNETNGFRTTAARQLAKVFTQPCGATFGTGGSCNTAG